MQRQGRSAPSSAEQQAAVGSVGLDPLTAGRHSARSSELRLHMLTAVAAAARNSSASESVACARTVVAMCMRMEGLWLKEGGGR